VSHLPAPADRLHRFSVNPFATLNQRLQMLSAAGKDVIRLDMGSPDLPPPPAVIAALSRSASDPTHHGYSPTRGDAGFRRAVADYYQRRFGVTLDADSEVLPLIGSKEGIINLSLAYLDRGDYALIPSIAYPSYAAGARLAGADVISVPMRAEDDYLLALNTPIANIEKAKLLWVNYPNNPTGAIAGLDFYERALAFCREHSLLLCSDNPYSEVVFGSYRAHSALEVPDAKDQAVEFMSLSKSYNMAGWRLGACVGNREVLDALLHVKSASDSAHFRAIYDAGSEAINNTAQSWLDERNARYAARRDTLIAALPEIGLEAQVPHGSLYVWARITDGLTDREYTESALSEASVSLTPGSTYGNDGALYIRFSLGIAEARLDEALQRLREWHKVRA